MAGHSHWAKIKRTKGVSDARRGKLFSRIAREITMAARLGGGDPGFNPRLRTAIATAKSESMPNDTIERAVKKGTGELAGENYEELTYEGYGPGGVALLVQTTTDNKNRTAAEIRSLFSKNNGNLGTPNSVAWMFHARGLIPVPAAGANEDAVMMAALDAGAEDVRTSGEYIEILTPPDKLYAVDEALRKAGIQAEPAKLTQVPANTVAVADPKTAAALLQLVEALEDHDDVQNVFANFDMPDGLAAP